MSETLRSVGLDVGTTTTQMILSELTVENRAGSFAVPEMEISQRKILYKSDIHFTPLLKDELVDAQALREIVDMEYARAGIRKQDVDTGAVIITGETSRKENASAVLTELSGYAGDFVVATAGPDLESVLAAKGAGAVEFSKRTGKTVLHMDIGGGTSNLALIEDGKIIATGCLNVGGRLVKLDQRGVLSYVSPVLREIFPGRVGEEVSRDEIRALCKTLVRALEAAAGRAEADSLLRQLQTPGSSRFDPPADAVISVSGGVAECIRAEKSWLAFSDMGPELGAAIRESKLCAGEFMLGAQTIRATVIGAGCHSTQLSGSTVFYRNIGFPLKNLPVVTKLQDLKKLDSTGVLALPGPLSGSYEQVVRLAEEIHDSAEGPVLLALEADAAKALGHQLALRRGSDAQILCIDRVKLEEGSYLDVGAPVGPSLPVVIKTLILSG